MMQRVMVRTLALGAYVLVGRDASLQSKQTGRDWVH
jgi:hypothetical protein